MSGFSRRQLARLSTPIDAAHLKVRDVDGRKISYIEGWYAVAQANRIFGLDGWSRQTLSLERLWEDRKGQGIAASYLARVRIVVCADGREIARDATGIAVADAASRGAAHERAAKAAETDATKRALATFGPAFGLTLYDKSRASARPDGLGLEIMAPDGSLLADDLSAEAFCSGMRQLVEQAQSAGDLLSLQRHNKAAMANLKLSHPDLRSGQRHYVDILDQLIARRLRTLEGPQGGGSAVKELPPPAPTTREPQTPIDKSQLPIGTPRRMRDANHLANIRKQACLVCERTPSHAHHLKFAQAAGVSLKVSDEYVVPLCALHHDSLHRSGNEQRWWQQRGIDALAVAQDLWARHRQGA